MLPKVIHLRQASRLTFYVLIRFLLYEPKQNFDFVVLKGAIQNNISVQPIEHNSNKCGSSVQTSQYSGVNVSSKMFISKK